jgi:hypothetical protein
MAEGNPLEGAIDGLDEKVGGIPVWVIGLGLGVLVAIVWWFFRGKNGDTDPTQVGVYDPESAEETPTEEDTTDPLLQWLSENPGSTAYPVDQNSLPITNAQWARYVTDSFLSRGDDPSIVTNAISKYLSNQGLSEAETAVINRALALMTPPEGVLPIKKAEAYVAPAAPSGFKVTGQGTTYVKLDWADIPGTRGYDVFVNGAYRTSVTYSWATIAFLKPNTEYTIGVQGIPKTGASGQRGPMGTFKVRTKK